MQGCSRAWTEGDGVHSLLCMNLSIMYILCTFVTLQTSCGIHPFLCLRLHPCPQVTCHCKRSQRTCFWEENSSSSLITSLLLFVHLLYLLPFPRLSLSP